MSPEPNQQPFFLVLTGDVVRSKTLPPDLLASIPERLTRLNAEEKGRVVSFFSLSRGDEVQGVLQDPKYTPVLARHLRYHLYPIQIRLGIGLGRIDPPLNPENSWAMNGEAFHFAREALEVLKDTARHRRTFCRTGREEEDQILNTIWQLVDALQQQWTQGQWEAIHAYEKAGTYRAAAAALGVALQNVEKRCSTARWPAVADAERTLGQLLAKIVGTAREGT